MRFDVNLPVADHPEVASDTDSFTRLFLTNYCKAPSRVRICNSNFHFTEIKKTENKGRLVTEYSIRLDKNRTSTQKEINVLLYVEHESLPSLGFITITEANVNNNFLSANYFWKACAISTT